VAERAGAAPVAAALRDRERIRDRKVGLILSGGNITIDGLRAALADQAERRALP
jgi:threonine dehydratase